ncbi:MAG: hypothetical protein BGO69_02985 [Bacteroidetes bacterium 46-16]|nr:MAG: hypothetical protein BGO69_02985 [Bacteroidetes bacterium 46-16]
MKKALLALSAILIIVIAFSCKKKETFCWACVNTYSYPDNPPNPAHTEFDTVFQCNMTKDEIENFRAQYPEQHLTNYTKYAMTCTQY